MNFKKSINYKKSSNYKNSKDKWDQYNNVATKASEH